MTTRASPFEAKVASFEPKPKAHRWPSAEEIDSTATFPTREGTKAKEGKVTLGINCSPATKDRFRALCKTERYTSEDMLAILLDNYQER